jgi:hypothetical protein
VRAYTDPAAGLRSFRTTLDEARNHWVEGDGEIAAGEVHVLILAAREDLEIARQVRGVLA